MLNLDLDLVFWCEIYHGLKQPNFFSGFVPWYQCGCWFSQGPPTSVLLVHPMLILSVDSSVIDVNNVRDFERERERVVHLVCHSMQGYSDLLSSILHTSKCINDRKSYRQKRYRLVKKTLLNREMMQWKLQNRSFRSWLNASLLTNWFDSSLILSAGYEVVIGLVVYFTYIK
jgi:hypothetical protein